MGRLGKVVALLGGMFMGLSPANAAPELAPARLFLVGDSTMADKPNLAYPERGWGQLLPGFMAPELTIINLATNGRSTKSFRDEGRWQAMLDQLQQGDYVLVQFGHNDQKKKDPSRYAAAESDYQINLTHFIHDVQEKGGIPMLASSICRRSFSEEGVLEHNLSEYAQAAKKVAAETKVSFFDLQQRTCDRFEALGVEDTKPLFLQVPAGLFEKYPDGKVDNTHLSTVGATMVAQFFVRELMAKQHPLARYIMQQQL